MTRAEEAQRLVDEGRVTITRTDSLITRALVRGKLVTYTTNIYPISHFSCTCDWGMFHSHTDDLCAHALALRLIVEKEKNNV